MIVDENVSGYIKSFEPDLPDYLAAIEKKGLIEEVPIIRKEAQALLRFLIKVHRPLRILEIGTAIGFSACFMAEYMPPGSKIYTIEKDSKRFEQALKNIDKCGKNSVIKAINGDAEDVLEGLLKTSEVFDFIFLDAAKAQYSVYMNYINSLIRIGGILLTDNILQEGSVASSKYAIPRRERTIHMRMREFISEMMNSEIYSSVIIPIGDGMLVSNRLSGGNDENEKA